MINQRIPKPTYASAIGGGGEKWPNDEIYDNIDQDLDGCDFGWISVYNAVANRLLYYRNDRKALIASLYKLPMVAHYLQHFEDSTGGKTRVNLTDICPFTVMATFNLEQYHRNNRQFPTDRVRVLEELCEFLDINATLDMNFHGVPTLPHYNPLFFADSNTRLSRDIEYLWEVFVAAMDYVRANSRETKEVFSVAYDVAIGVNRTKWNLSIGLFWMSAEHFLTLDENSREFIEEFLRVPIRPRAPSEACSSRTYLTLIRKMKTFFGDCKYPFNDFTELSRTARMETPPYETNDIRAVMGR